MVRIRTGIIIYGLNADRILRVWHFCMPLIARKVLQSTLVYGLCIDIDAFYYYQHILTHYGVSRGLIPTLLCLLLQMAASSSGTLHRASPRIVILRTLSVLSRSTLMLQGSAPYITVSKARPTCGILKVESRKENMKATYGQARRRVNHVSSACMCISIVNSAIYCAIPMQSLNIHMCSQSNPFCGSMVCVNTSEKQPICVDR